MRRHVIQKTRSALLAFLATESSGGIVLLASAVAAMVWANAGAGYDQFWHQPMRLAGLEKDLRHWVNDGLMTIFFLVVGLEIKRELVLGELREVRVATMPVVAAVGGMVGPASIYLAINAGGGSPSGWAIPMATDIAFVVGAMALLGQRVPSGLKVFLLALAIVDDIGAILVIALVFSDRLDLRWAVLAAVCVLLVVGLRRVRITWPSLYLLPGIGIWWAAVHAGIHPTLAGVLLGFLIPARPIRDRDVLGRLEQRLHPVSSFVVIPVFALANAGISLDGGVLGAAFGSRIFWGVSAGLVVGKGFGIFAASALAARLRLAKRPADVDNVDLAGGAVLAGIGFTVSLFIAPLAFRAQESIVDAKMGVLVGSLVSAVVASALFLVQRRTATNPGDVD